MKRTILSVSIVSLLVLRTFALEPQSDGLFVRVVDVGAGLCCVVKMPGNHYMVYDAGNYEDSARTAKVAINSLIPSGAKVDLLVLSHTDSDHIAGVPYICDNYHVGTIVHPGLDRDSMTLKKVYESIQREQTSDGARVINLAKTNLPPGTKFELGATTVTFVCGFSEPPEDWDIENQSEYYNAGSIVVKVEYKGKTVLFCGDAVGRHLDDPPDSCIAEEKFMVDNADNVPIRADVLVAPHHGADNGSSVKFINAVKPTYVIFSAGHKFEHPRRVTALRYLSSGVLKKNMFRTDRGDNEGGKEWLPNWRSRVPDPRGDDDVDVLITNDQNLTVAYRNN